MKNNISHKTKEGIEKLNNEISQTIKEGGDLNVITSRRKKVLPLNSFVILFAQAFLTAIEKCDLGIKEVKLMLKIIDYAKFGNLINLPRKRLMEDLGISKYSLSRSLRKLHDSGLLMTIDDVMYFNPQFISKGNLFDFCNDEQLIEITEVGAKIMSESLDLPPNLLTKKMKREHDIKEMEKVTAKAKREELVPLSLLDMNN